MVIVRRQGHAARVHFLDSSDLWSFYGGAAGAVITRCNLTSSSTQDNKEKEKERAKESRDSKVVCTTVPDGQQQQDGRTKKTTAN
uniref:Uncharacterized protein n=1 Tax=Daphnia galeata TaxID=27404 RepID=A0A8J2RJP7_9CRUS|nr:unnamed protein product [Daphnia galeata]